MLEIDPTGHCGCTAIRSDWKGNEVIASASSEAFTRCLHSIISHRTPIGKIITFRYKIPSSWYIL